MIIETGAYLGPDEILSPLGAGGPGEVWRARDTDVWQFMTPAEVRQRWATLAPQLGRRLGFWEFLLSQWQKAGLLGE